MFLIKIGGELNSHFIDKSTQQIYHFPSISLYFILEAIHFYTGQFNECRPILLSTITHHYRNQIHDIYVDNTMAALKSPDLLHRACNEIRNVIR